MSCFIGAEDILLDLAHLERIFVVRSHKMSLETGSCFGGSGAGNAWYTMVWRLVKKEQGVLSLRFKYYLKNMVVGE